MKLIHHVSELRDEATPVCLAIGVFDGVHLGHQQVIGSMVAAARAHSARPVVATFDQHPAAVLAPERAPRLIYTIAQRLQAFASLGAEVVLLLRFDHAFSQTPAEDFVRDLAGRCERLRGLWVGSLFRFGFQRRGHVALLKTLGHKLGFQVHAISSVRCDDQVVSSTRIRQAIAAGALAEVGRWLGRPYSLWGRIVRGQELGRKLGFPTANLDTAGLVLPPNGVYAAWGRAGSWMRPAVVNIGQRPTLGDAAAPVRVEAHLLDFEGDLYERELEVVLGEKLRPERPFASLQALREQMGRDIEAARALLRPPPP